MRVDTFVGFGGITSKCSKKLYEKINVVFENFSYGYPDDGYLERVQQELSAIGIKKEMVD